jgi:hypothetical protein
MPQERMDGWIEYAMEYAKAERELRIERWVFISIECEDEAGRGFRLHPLLINGVVLDWILSVLGTPCII